MGTSTTSPGAAARARRAGPSSAAGADTADTADTAATGSVARCAASHSVPVSASTAATPTPEAGCTSVASRVTAPGPMMKHSSSATDSNENAVCSRDVPESSVLHRALTIVPSDGMVAPEIAPGRKKAQVGALSSTARISPAVDSTNTRTSGCSTQRWPCPSASRATLGATNA